MRVMHLITDLNVGGAEMMLYNLVVELMKQQIKVCVVCLGDKGHVGDQMEELGIEVHYLLLKNGWSIWRAIMDCQKAIRQFKPSIMQTWMYHADFVGSLATLFNRNIKLIWGIHHTLGIDSPLKDSTKLVMKINSWLSRWVPQKIVCCSNSAMTSHINENYDPKKLMVISNGIDLTRFYPDPQTRREVRRELKLPDDAQVIGMLARFDPQKDHLTFIRAAAMIAAKFPRAHFILAGKDIDEWNSNLGECVNATGFSQKFQLLGLRPDAGRILSSLDVFCLSSAYGEAMPMVICEAMACGVPCVVTDVGDSKEMVGETGICVKIRNPGELEAGLEQMLRLPQLEYQKFSREARLRIEKNYNILTVAGKYLSLYQEMS